MKASTSLRVRLTAIILIPLLAIAMAVGYWQVQDARSKAAEIFDRSLLTVALAVKADVASARGNAVSIDTRAMLSDSLGGPVFYHVYAPNGYYVTGYATPPVLHSPAPETEEPYFYYNSTYHAEEVRALRLRDITTIDGITGTFTITVWQHVIVRDAFMKDLALRSFTVMAVLIGTVALVVWFGVLSGLRPLIDLEDAISKRSSDDLSPIRRQVPPETRGLVQRLNSLFGQVELSMARQASFISNAAHQLRNPIAGVLAMAEAVRSAPTKAEAQSRADELLTSAREVKDLANKLLTLERASNTAGLREPVDLAVELDTLYQRMRPSVTREGVTLSLQIETDDPAIVLADPVMLREALTNLLDNALRHGGPEMTRIQIGLRLWSGQVLASVSDDGRGVAAKDVETVLSRFGQAGPSQGSGLGLSIAEAVAQAMGGSLNLTQRAGGGLEVTMRLPLAPTTGDQRPAA